MTGLSSNDGGAKLGATDVFHLAVGRAIDAWGSIEDRLQETFATCLSFSPPRGAGFVRMSPFAIAILDAAPELPVKLNLVEAAVRSALLDVDRATEILDEWTASRRKIAGLEQYMFALVHWTVAQELDEDGRITQVVLRPRHPGITDAQPLTIAAIETSERRFLAAAQRLTLLNERIAADVDRQRAHVIEFAEQLSSANNRDALADLLNERVELPARRAP